MVYCQSNMSRKLFDFSPPSQSLDMTGNSVANAIQSTLLLTFDFNKINSSVLSA